VVALAAVEESSEVVADTVIVGVAAIAFEVVLGAVVAQALT